MNLLLDIGHTRAKLGAEQGGHVRRKEAFPLGDAEALCAALREARPQAESLRAVSTLQGPTARTLHGRIEEAWGRPVAWVDAAQACGEIRIRYARPETFGADRLLAMRAAWRRTVGPCMVVDAGTAVTVDGVTAGGEHCGGWIVPGCGMLREAMGGLLELGEVPEIEPGGTRHAGTGEAAEAGLWNLLAGGIDRMCAQLREGPLGAEAAAYVAGGDAEHLSVWCRTELVSAPDLVLEGLVLCAADSP